MRFRLALTVFALAALQAGAASAQTPTLSTRGDMLDEWCKTVSLPSSIAICSEPELRALAAERQNAYDEAKAKLTAEQQKALLADQNGWVKSYPVSCGLAPNQPPSLPLAPAIKNCMAQAGRARIAYLRGYGGSPNIAAVQPSPAASPIAKAPDRIGPGFDCAKAAQPLAQLICSSPELSRTDLLFNQAYQALRQQLDPAGQRQLQAEDVAFLNSVLLGCGIPENGPVAGSPDCVAAHYSKKRSEWLSRLSGPAYEEAKRPIAHHLDLQEKLQLLGFLPATAKIDGVYSSATRAAIVAWQNASGRPVTGFMGDADAALFAEREQSAPAQLAASAPVATRPPAMSQAAPAGDEVSLTEKGGTYLVPVRINDAITLDFLIDSGASDVLIPADVAMTLFRTKTLSGGDFLGERTYVLADGSKLPSTRFTLRQLKVGNHVLLNVAASVGPATSEPLLGQSFLGRFGSWTMDNGRHVLLLTKPGANLASGRATTVALPPTHSFDRFPVAEVYRGPPVMPDFQGRDREFKDFRTRIRNGINEGTNFAGRHKVIQFGCGTGCSFVVVADVTTGQVFSFPHGGEYDQMLQLEYRVSSNLIRAWWVPNLENMDGCLQEDFLLKVGHFESLGRSGLVACPVR